MELLRFATAGSVDDGKSTLIGRLLYDTKTVFEDQIESVERVRYRTMGDANLTAAVRSDADTIEKVVEETAATRLTERGATRGDDRFSEAAMEDRKREGYF